MWLSPSQLIDRSFFILVIKPYLHSFYFFRIFSDILWHLLYLRSVLFYFTLTFYVFYKLICLLLTIKIIFDTIPIAVSISINVPIFIKFIFNFVHFPLPILSIFPICPLITFIPYLFNPGTDMWYKLIFLTTNKYNFLKPFYIFLFW